MNRAPDTNQAFLQAYAALNPDQRLAVDTIEGPVMVIAGPGTGKTQILTLRIANILLKTDTAPSSILALTFTDSGAKAMRKRLVSYIGATAYQIPIHTFHSFAGLLIREYPECYEHIIGSRPAGDMEKFELMEAIVAGLPQSTLRPTGNPTYYVKPLLKMVQDLKKEHVTPDDLSGIIARQEADLLSIPQYHEKGAHKGKVRGDYTKQVKMIEKNQNLLHAYRQYEAALRAESLHDFEDMIAYTIQALEQNEDLVLDLQERYQYILADEHQDVNGSQNRIIEILSDFHDQPNVFVVGDEKQAIFRFQGASLDNFLFFRDRYPDTTVISLSDNYRSGQSILDAAHELIKVEEGPLMDLRTPLRSATDRDGEVSRRIFSHQGLEDEWLVDTIGSLIDSGTPPQEIAVIVRTNREVETFATLLRRRGFKAAASADGDILAHPITHAVEALLSVVVSDTNEQKLAAVLHGSYWGLTLDDTARILAGRSHSRTLIEILSDRGLLVELGVTDVEAAARIPELIAQARELELTKPPHRVLDLLLAESGLIRFLMKNDPEDSARVLRRLYDEIEELVIRNELGSIKAVCGLLARRRAYGLPLNAPFLTANSDAVAVMTAHKSKGLEFTAVFIPHLHDQGWGGGAARSYFTVPLASSVAATAVDPHNDEYRLLYVAMTRAKTTLFLSSAEQSSDSKNLTPSRLIADISEGYMPVLETADYEASHHPLAQLGRNETVSSYSPGLLRDLFSTRGFSATSINNYIANPWDYVYRNLLRIPETQNQSMQFGTAMHSVLEQVTHHFTDHGLTATDTELKQWLERALARLPINDSEFAALMEKGLRSLYAYVPHMIPSLTKDSTQEISLSVELETGIKELPILPLTGKIDRIDVDEQGRALRVVDYKTGQPKSRNVIEGKTASSLGNYKRQLVFYALILELSGQERYACRNGLISFVEPTAQGVIKEESFTVTDSDLQTLRSEITAAVLMFLDDQWVFDRDLQSKSQYADILKLIDLR